MDDLTNNGWNFTEHRDDYLPTPPPCPPSPDCPCPPPRPLPPMPPMPGCPPRPCPPDPCQNRTPNYGLPLWKASDVTSWLMQMNGAMLRIDNIMHDLALRTGINGLPDDLVTTVSKLCQDVAVLNCTVGELSNKQANQDLLMQNMNTQFSAMKTDIASLQLSITNLDTRVMTVDSANQQNRNDITLIKSDLNMLSKTVTNLSSNLTQFQNATNQTLATLQASVDAIETWMENPSKSLALIDRTIFTKEHLNEYFKVSNPEAISIRDSGRSHGTLPVIEARRIVGDVCELFYNIGERFVLQSTDINLIRGMRIYIDIPSWLPANIQFNKVKSIVTLLECEYNETTGVYNQKSNTAPLIFDAIFNCTDGKINFYIDWGQNTYSVGLENNKFYMIGDCSMNALITIPVSTGSNLNSLEQYCEECVRSDM